MDRASLVIPVGTGLFCQRLLQWYRRQKRDLPWRVNRDAYRIWLSEVMLQQTRVTTVIPYFERFVKAYPSFDDLADAEEDHVLDLWSGLGYYSRARNLHKTAQIIRDRYNGEFPCNYREAIGLPGIGSYSAAAILSIAFGQPYPVLDGNVRRVMARYLALREEVKGPLLKDLERLLSEIANSSHMTGNIADFNQALMELGAIVCTPQEPDCPACPLLDSCAAFSDGLQSELPITRRKSTTQSISFTAAIVEREGRYLMCRNNEDDYLTGLWEFPKVAGKYHGEKVAELFWKVHRLRLSARNDLDPVIHHVTFRRIRFYPVLATLRVEPDDGRFHWVRFGEKPYPTSSYIRKILRQVSADRYQ